MSPTATELDRRELLVALSLLLAAAFSLYAGTFGNAWTYDDFPVIVDNPDIRSISDFLRDTYPGRPLREITYLLDHAIFGLNPAGWHIQSIFWHGLNAFFVFLLATRLRLGRAVAWGAALLFLAHPLQVEVVANISHRKDSLALAFSLLAVLIFIESFQAGRWRLWWIAGSFLMAGIAYTGKQNAVLLPVVFAAYESVFVSRSDRFLLRYRIVPSGALLLAVALLVYVALSKGGEFHSGMRQLLVHKANYLEPATADIYFPMVLKSWAFMFLKVAVPVGLALEYTYPVPVAWTDPWALAALAALLAYGAGLWLSFRKAPAVFFALVWIGVFWLPVSNLWPLSYFAADRYLYAPLAGLALLLALAAPRLLPGRISMAVFGVAVVLLSTLTWQQCRVWRSPEELWAQAVRVNPTSSYALNNLGNVLLVEGNLVLAREYYDRAAQANPLNPTSHYNLGLIYESIGDRRLALYHFRKFLFLDDPIFRPEAKLLRARLRQTYGMGVLGESE